MSRIGSSFVLISLLSVCSVFAANDDATTMLEAYITELVPGMIPDEELFAFAERLANGELANPIPCKTTYCSAARRIHYGTLEEYVELEDGEIDISRLTAWVHKFMKRRGRQRKESEEAARETKSLFPHLIPSKISISPFGDVVCAVHANHDGVCWGHARSAAVPPPPTRIIPGPISQIVVSERRICTVSKDNLLHCSDLSPLATTWTAYRSLVEVSMNAANAYPLDEWAWASCQGCSALFDTMQSSSDGRRRMWFLMCDGTVQCREWGATKCPDWQIPSDFGTAVQISAGSSSLFMAINKRGQARVWDSGYMGKKSHFDFPKRLKGKIIQVSAGRFTFGCCALDDTGSVECLSSLGGHTSLRGDGLEATLSKLDPIVQISSGSDELCVVDWMGRARCFDWQGAEVLPPPPDMEVDIKELLPRFSFYTHV